MKRKVTLKKLTMSKLRKYKTRNANKTTLNPQKKRTLTLRERISYAPYKLFDRIDDAGNLLCRYPFCDNYTKNGLRYCSITCRKKFVKYHETNFMWNNVRIKIFNRDKLTCKICQKQCSERFLECDHIRPISLLKEYGYTKLNLRAFEEYIYADTNLRTLCKTCHKDITKAYVSNKANIKKHLTGKI